jgi:transcriptional regulator with XRE-family HTH domain
MSKQATKWKEFSPTKLREYRAGTTRRELAARTGVTEGVIYKWEKGKSKPDANHLKRLALALSIDLEDLYE